jgi:aquaporin Z
VSSDQAFFTTTARSPCSARREIRPVGIGRCSALASKGEEGSERGPFPTSPIFANSLQLIGASLACLFLLAIFGDVGHLGATLPGPGYADWQAFLMEVALTATLVSVILGTASAAQNVGPIAALAVGGYIALAGLWAAPVSGVSMNPARSFGPALVSGDFTSYWVYVAGPILGALIAVGCAIVLRGSGGSAISRAAGSGKLDLGRPRRRR